MRPGRRARRVLALAGLLVFVAWFGDGVRPRAARVPAERRSALQLTAAARDARARLSGARGEERARRREEAIAAYEALSSAADVPLAERALADYRCAELARAGGQPARARAAFLRVLAVAAGDLARRARLELGHLERRAGEYEAAARHYEELVLAGQETPYLHDEALYWLARVRRLARSPCAALPLLELLLARTNRSTMRTRAERELQRVRDEATCE